LYSYWMQCDCGIGAWAFESAPLAALTRGAHAALALPFRLRISDGVIDASIYRGSRGHQRWCCPEQPEV